VRAMEAKQASEVADSARAGLEALSNLSHELRTPLNGILGLSGLLLDDNLTAEQREQVDTIRRCGDTLLNLVNDILDFASAQSGEICLSEGAFDLRETIASVTDLLVQRAQAKGLPVTVRMEANVPARLTGDAGRLRQVLLHLVGNAIKFTERGEVGVTVAVDGEAHDRCVLRFSVRDTGAGIPPEQQRALFAPFARADTSASRANDGVGLGLAIARRIVEAMGGQIGVESAAGQGATFWFTARFAADRSGPTTAKPQEPAEPAPRMRVLVVEDNPVSQKIALLQLEKLGHRADGVSNGLEALTALEKLPYDVVLMDCQMPVMDGFTATAEIRRREGAGKHTRILALTANALASDREKCLAAGMDDFLSKPVSPDDLRKALARGPAASAATASPAVEASAPIDWQRLHDIAGDDSQMLKEMIEMYLQQTAEQFEELRVAIEAANAGDVHRLAHSCKGTSATCGVMSLVSPLRELEYMGRDGKLGGAAQLFSQVTREFDRLKELLRNPPAA